MTSFTGTVVARYRRHCLIEDECGKRISCQLKRRSLKPVVGDSVLCVVESSEGGVLVEIESRHSELARIDSRGRREIVAANLSQLVVVLAPDPLPDWFLVDRYLVAAELSRLAAVLVFNKIDKTADVPSELKDYALLNYTIYQTSAHTGTGLSALAAALREHRSVMIGQSGVGKSSLINSLLEAPVQTVATLSAKSGQGRHTTTTAVLYSLPDEGELIDSPGVRDYAPYIADSRAVANGYREFQSFSAQCRFPDCMHMAEPDCAVKRAVKAGQVEETRYASYGRLVELTESLLADRY